MDQKNISVISLFFITSHCRVVYILQGYRQFLSGNTLVDALPVDAITTLYNSPPHPSAHKLQINFVFPDMWYILLAVCSINITSFSLLIEMWLRIARCLVQSINRDRCGLINDNLFSLDSDWSRVVVWQFWPKRCNQFYAGNMGIYFPLRKRELCKEKFIVLMCEDIKP